MSRFNCVSKDGGKTGASPRKPMGIQFVKSSETLQPLSTTNNSDSHQVSKSSGLLPRPPQNFNAGNSLLGVRSSQPTRFGSPAVNFFSHTSNNTGSSELPSRYSQAFVKSGDSYSSLKGEVSPGQGYRMPGFSNLDKAISPSTSTPTHVVNFQKVTEAKPLSSMDQYIKAWKGEKDPMLNKFRKLAYEVVTLKSDRPNAKDKLHSAANRVPLRIEFNTQPVFGAKNRSFLCYVYIENISIASGQGAKIKDSKTNAYEAALQKILMPYMRVVPTDPTSKELQVSEVPFTSPPPEPSKVPLHNPITDGIQEVTASQHKESNLESAGRKRRYNEYKPLDDFVIVEPKVPIPDCTPAQTLRRSADFNHMLLEYEYFFKGEAARCVLKIENEKLADVNGISKVAAKNNASAQALLHLKKFCWIIKTKQAVDSNTKISKEDIVNDLNEQSIDNDNIGNKMLRKMGWSGGGVGKDGSGIAEPVSLKSVLNRQGLGLSESKGITNDFRQRIKEVIENYAASDNQEDLVFSCDFRLEERQIVHDECRRLNLQSKSRGKGVKRYLCVRRKRSVNQLFDHLTEVGGETLRYQLVPPGQDVSTNRDQSSQLPSNPSKPQTGSGMLGSSSQSLLGNVPNWQAGNQFMLQQQSDQKVGHSPDSGNGNGKMTSHVSINKGGSFFGGGNQTSGSQSHYNPCQNRLGQNVGQQCQSLTHEVGEGNFRNNPEPLLSQTRSNTMGPMTPSGNNNNSHFGNSFRDSGPQGQTTVRNDPNDGFQNCGSRMGMGNFSFGNNSNDFNFSGIAKGDGGDGRQWMRPPQAGFGSNDVSGRTLPQKQQSNSMKQEGPMGNSYNDCGVMMNSSGGNQMVRNETGFGNDFNEQGQGFYANNPSNMLQRAGGGMMGNHGWNSDSSGQWGMGQQSDGSGGSMMGSFGHGGMQQYPNQGYNWDGEYK